MDSKSVGLIIIGLGAAAVFVGLGVMAGVFDWIGHLPGDLRFEGKSVRVYFPLVSMLLFSIALTVVLNLIRRI